VRVAQLVIGGDVAGGQLVALRFADALRSRGDDVLFVSPHGGPFVDRVRAEGYEVAFHDVGRTYRALGALRLARLLRSRRVDVLHTHTLAAANALGRVAGRAAGVPVISHLHIENHFRPASRLLLRGLDNATARLASRLVAVSESTRSAYERQGYPNRIEVLYNGVDVDLPAANGSLKGELGIDESTPLIGEVGRLCDVKGQRELIEALALVPRARLILVGRDLEQGGAFQRGLEAAADRHGVRDRVVFAGELAADDVLGEFDVFALPSWTEGLPLVVLEAMAHGRPVVATPVGGTPEVVVDGETGLLVPPRDPQALAAALRRLLDDADLRRRLGEAGRARAVERFNADAMTRRMLELYDEVAA
jgi:glycosyltransferase involved in cell wall biosynthesis